MSISHATIHQGAQAYKNEITIREHALIADEPSALHGQNLGPTAVEMVAAALGACTATTLKMYAARKGWDLQAVDVEVDIDWRVQPQSVVRRITLTGPLDAEQRARLMQIADACPVHKLLANAVPVVTE